MSENDSSTRIQFKTGGKEVDIDIDDFTGLEEREFRLATGKNFMETLAGFEVGDISLEGLAGFVWLSRKRDEKDLAFLDVLGSVRYRDLIDSFAEDEAEEPEAEEPEAEESAPRPEGGAA